MAELTDVLSWLDGWRHSVAADVFGVALPEMVRDIVEGMEGFEWLAKPLRDAAAGFGAMNEHYGIDLTATLGQFGRSLQDVVALGRDFDLLGNTLVGIGKSVDSMSAFIRQ